jgi:hypothetical protein
MISGVGGNANTGILHNQLFVFYPAEHPGIFLIVQGDLFCH